MQLQSIYRDDQPAPEVPRLALRPREAAIALGMSEKALWSATSLRGGPIPALKHGSRVLYWTHQLQEWADRELARQHAASQVDAEGGNV